MRALNDIEESPSGPEKEKPRRNGGRISQPRIFREVKREVTPMCHGSSFSCVTEDGVADIPDEHRRKLETRRL